MYCNIHENKTTDEGESKQKLKNENKNKNKTYKTCHNMQASYGLNIINTEIQRLHVFKARFL